jgi:hypothetical protein
MSRVAELIDLIVQGKNAEASDVLNQELLSRSYSQINDMKSEVAQNYFAPVVDMSDPENIQYVEPETTETTEEEA